MHNHNPVPNFFPLHLHFCNKQDIAWVLANQPDGSQTALKLTRKYEKQSAMWATDNTIIKTFTGEKSQRQPVNMTAISDNDFLMAHASPLMSVCFIKFSELNEKGVAEPWWLTAGSQAVKTFVADPDFPGISKVKITPNKLVVAIGNVIRAYSFDIKD